MKKFIANISRKLKAVSRKFSRGLTSIATIAVSACALLLARPAMAQVSPTSLYGITNVPLVVAASVATNGYTNQVLLLTKNCALAFAAQFYQTNSVPGVTVTVGGSFSIDTTNFGIAPFTLSGLAASNNAAWVQAGTNLVNNSPIVISTNWSQNTLSGYAAVMLNVFTNSASTTSIFNAGCKFSRPTLNTQTY